jgi:hypothetical protein
MSEALRVLGSLQHAPNYEEDSNAVVGCLTTFSATRTIYIASTGYKIYELERIWKETIVV